MTALTSPGIRPQFMAQTARRVVACLVMMLLAFAGPLNPARADPQTDAANAVITAMIGDLEAYLASDADGQEQRTIVITRILDSYFDLPTIARFSVGPYWRAASEGEREAFSAAMRLNMIQTVVRNFDQLTGLKFVRTDTQTKGDKMVLLRGNFLDVEGVRPPITVGWRILTPAGEQARVLDVEIENISMLVTQQQENIAIIRKNEGRFSALIEAMRLQAAN